MAPPHTRLAFLAFGAGVAVSPAPDARCAAHPGCVAVGLKGDNGCCPTDGGIQLACCDAPLKTCEDYFGSLDDGIFTVADPDVGITDASAPYCEGSGIFGRTCTFMHLAGHSCANPTPPDGCHHYHKVQYSECPELDSFNYAYDDNTRIDTTGAFDDQGVFVACADRVISNEVFCFGPPADSPVQCQCPSDDASVESASIETSDPPCGDYFGSLDGIFTVADPDVGITDASTPICEGSGIFGRTCTYMHLAGHSCVGPAPSDGCHHYHKVQYSECPELDSFTYAGIDTTGAFDDQGVFVACADRVISHEVLCYGPPKDSPVQCQCPSDNTSVESASIETSDKPCEDYFGSLDGIFTVADPDVGITDASAPYCEGSGIFGRTCTYMHLAGHSCANPAPPDGCHHYHKVQYSECPELDSFKFAYDDNTRIDTTGAFDDQGVFVACADRVISNEVLCFGPPADSPVQCVCGSDQTVISV